MLDPHYATAFHNRGALWYDLNEYDKAIKDCTEAIKLQPKDASVYVSRGLARSCKREYERAIEDYAEAVRLDPKNASGFKLFAALLATCPVARHRDGKRAVELAARGCALTQWKDPGHLDALASAYAESGDFEQAVKYQKQAIAAFPPAERQLHGDYSERLRLFEQGQAYHEPLPRENLQRAGKRSSGKR